MAKTKNKVIVSKCSSAKLPQYQTNGSAGCDVCAEVIIQVWLQPGESRLIPTGLKVIIPHGYCIRILPRSGLAIKNITCHAGLIDSDYRDEIKILLVNNSDHSFQVNQGDRIAQMILQKVERIDWEIINNKEFDNTVEKETNDRKGGFGSTGK